jgi:hypothetical protein
MEHGDHEQPDGARSDHFDGRRASYIVSADLGGALSDDQRIDAEDEGGPAGTTGGRLPEKPQGAEDPASGFGRAKTSPRSIWRRTSVGCLTMSASGDVTEVTPSIDYTLGRTSCRRAPAIISTALASSATYSGFSNRMSTTAVPISIRFVFAPTATPSPAYPRGFLVDRRESTSSSGRA